MTIQKVQAHKFAVISQLNELEHFIRHYERLTRHMLETMPKYADTIINVNDEHRMVGMIHKS